MFLAQLKVSPKLQQFVELSNDGYGIFDSDDTLLYCNQKFSELLSVPIDSSKNVNLEDLLRENHKNGRGIRISSGDIEAFINYTKKVRRSRDFRLFEVDFIDGRWFLFSEQLNEHNEILVQIKDITKQKVSELSLEEAVSDLRTAALTDELTKVGNRRALVESVANELSRCRRSGASMTMFLIDLDHFKAVNDTYGHQGGDVALRHVADLIKISLRPYDILGRIGGEEFAVFLSNTVSEDGLQIAERTRKAIQNSPIDYNGRVINLSISIGLTTLGCNAEFENLYEQADEALYRSKKAGRNRVTVY